MSKKTVILIALCFVAGVAITFFTGFNPLTAITNFVASPTDTLSSITETLTHHWQLLVSGVTGFAGAFTIFSKVYGSMKQKKQEAQELLQGQLSETDEAKAKVDAELDATKMVLTEQTATITEAEANLTQTQQALSAKQAEVDRLIIEKNEAQRLFGERYVDDVEKAIEKSKRVP